MKLNVKAKILEIMDEKDDWFIKDIARRVCLERHTISRYLNVMEKEGTITHRKVGTYLIWSKE